MRLSVKALAIALGILWASCTLLVGMVNLAIPSYGGAFLQLVSSIYPGYHNSRRFLDVLVGAGYALVDGAIGGMVFAWLYNAFVGHARHVEGQ